MVCDGAPNRAPFEPDTQISRIRLSFNSSVARSLKHENGM